MSVNFYPATRRPSEFVPGTQVISFVDGDTADDLTVSMANPNAGRVLEALGLPTDGDEGGLVGDAPAEDFLGRVLLAEALTPVDGAMPAYRLIPGETVGPFAATEDGAAVWIAPRREGYIQERLSQLRELAEYCHANHYLVAWA